MTEIQTVKVSSSKSPSDKVAVIVADLKRRGASRPRAVKTLASSINSIFKKQLTEQEIQLLLGELKEKGINSIVGTKVSYTLPD
ncbi:hypothetical protein [Limnobacter sp.]|uniref:hypothetical protein n=1 Tax=Limnobacter sp. TaxID=2003368 RepID=UPI002734953B|nr:hypothetical protein [Limnobacter sp.]MDP3188975.1 hypothetical protein [Limnobacter sp.]